MIYISTSKILYLLCPIKWYFLCNVWERLGDYLFITEQSGEKLRNTVLNSFPFPLHPLHGEDS